MIWRIRNVHAGDLLEYIHGVLRDNEAGEERALALKMSLVKHVRILASLKIAGACAASVLEAERLEDDEPCEREQVGEDDVGAHHVEQVATGLQSIHEGTEEKQH